MASAKVALEQAWQRASVTARTVVDGTATPCRLFSFEDGRWALLSVAPCYQARVVTHLLGWRGDGPREDAEVAVRAMPSLRVGDTLLFLRGSPSDAIRVTADRLLRSGVRERSLLWQRALRRFRDRNRLNNQGIWKRLAQAGIRREPGTIAAWLDDDDMIAPRGATRGFLKQLATFTADRELRNQADDCEQAIREVRGAHARASNQLARIVLQRVGERLSMDSIDASVAAIAGQVQIATIDAIDPQARGAPRALVNQLQGDPR